jgi:hypothetical protein
MRRRAAMTDMKITALWGCLLFETLQSTSLNGNTESLAMAKTSLETATIEMDVLRIPPVIEIMVATTWACGPKAKAYMLINGCGAVVS